MLGENKTDWEEQIESSRYCDIPLNPPPAV